MISNRVLQLLAISAGLMWAGAASGAEFIPLPQLPDSTQAGDAFAVSGDGSTVVGSSHDGSVFQAVRWTLGPVLTVQPLGVADFSFARGVSADGNVVAGYRAFPGGQDPFRWTPTTGAVLLGHLPGGTPIAAAYGVSADGSVVVGGSVSANGSEAFRWTSAEGMIALGDLPGGEVASIANATSSDGRVVVGYGVSSSGTEAFRWSPESGMVGLGDLPESGFFSDAYDVSADGSVIVGRSAGGAFPFSWRAFRWTAETGMVALPDVPGIGPTDRAEGISGDGNVIVGTADDLVRGHAMVWDIVHGSRELAGLLTSQGAELTGWRLQVARSASHDGLTVAGLGINPEGLQQPWVARLDAGTFVPEPTSILLAGVAVLLLFLFARCRFQLLGGLR
jgi:probable HAF family extracellular repeat protein